jgi:hypothetical protein
MLLVMAARCMRRVWRDGAAGPRGFLAGGDRSGQTMIEYVIVASMLVLAASILAVFLYAFREYGGRVLDLVASEYP